MASQKMSAPATYDSSIPAFLLLHLTTHVITRHSCDTWSIITRHSMRVPGCSTLTTHVPVAIHVSATILNTTIPSTSSANAIIAALPILEQIHLVSNEYAYRTTSVPLTSSFQQCITNRFWHSSKHVLWFRLTRELTVCSIIELFE